MEQKKFKIKGTEYTFQKLSNREFIKLQKRCKSGGDIDEEIFYDEIFEHIVINPKISLDDDIPFDTLDEVAKQAMMFQRGARKSKARS